MSRTYPASALLPKLDGLTLLRQLRAQGIATHVLIRTARDTTPDRIRGLDAGADDYLVKPFEFAELLARGTVGLRPRPRHMGTLRVNVPT